MRIPGFKQKNTHKACRQTQPPKCLKQNVAKCNKKCFSLATLCKRVILNIKYNNVPFVKTLGGHRQRVVKEGCRR